MDELIQQYSEHLRAERNVSPHTLRNYLSDLAQFHAFLRERELCLDSGNVNVRKIDVHIVRAFLAALNHDRKMSSIGRKLAALNECVDQESAISFEHQSISLPDQSSLRN